MRAAALAQLVRSGEAQLGRARWEQVYRSLLKPRVVVNRPNLLLQAQTPGSPPQEPPLLRTYAMDPCSVLVAHCGEIVAGSSVLDMCAAPGGKSLVLLERLVSLPSDAATFRFVANDKAVPRHKRLRQTFRSYAPEEVLALRVKVTNKDAVHFGGPEGKGKFDFVLVDAPCTSERWLLAENPTLDEVSYDKRVKTNAKAQQKLLRTALKAIGPGGGHVVYSTCALSDAENDGVVGAIMRNPKLTRAIQVVRPDLGACVQRATDFAQAALLPPEPLAKYTALLRGAVEAAEMAQFGWTFLPTDSCNVGPMYVSVLRVGPFPRPN